MKIIFACGGTGGHIYPALAVAEDLIKQVQNAEVLFAGNKSGMEASIIPQRGYDFKGIEARPLIRKFTFKNIVNGVLVIKSLFDALKIVNQFRPDMVVGTGGFASFPFVLSAALTGRKTLIHEPNVYPGLANRMLAAAASAVTVGFMETKKYFPAKKASVTGNPVREGIIKADKAEGYTEFELDPAKKVLLIMPGSRAAKKINRVIEEALPEIEKQLADLQLLWMCGDEDYVRLEETVKKYKIKIKLLKFINKAELAYAAADAGVLRAGAGTLTEITACGLPSVLVPYPHATGNHQEKNAVSFAQRQAALVIKDSALNVITLMENLKKVLDVKFAASMREKLLSSYAGNGAENITRIILKITGELHG
ncbi:MAG: undecaprenyldiphospho-muramoylpentapeptide beta-N-acetylglucosaminyltransferase [Candidatus Goldiibacteriota bacterium HGW-Goldbacteria-1]|jgi:UDP-N-acetylglucosamine--N-acetylmuramyl-(pentapeptide) pyrophosphoryl-undecaprenol N-acetylglucosamine transferase|nr:MAG: undecaprenyldiphospho-muramoylpentapeptide beta-N-acetylglucosaminyltransferase [Candidatus Goldiibacteriota bacterium HGW-Goldbacteria-1]